MKEEKNGSKPDLEDGSDIERLVNAFYERVRGDAVIGFIFEEVAQVDWETHLPKMYAFWETVLFGTGGFRGNPLAVHAKLVPHTEMGSLQFDRWLSLFQETVDELFVGERASHLKRIAEDMANVIFSKINGVPDPRFDPAYLTSEQRNRSRNDRTLSNPASKVE